MLLSCSHAATVFDRFTFSARETFEASQIQVIVTKRNQQTILCCVNELFVYDLAHSRKCPILLYKAYQWAL